MVVERAFALNHCTVSPCRALFSLWDMCVCKVDKNVNV